MKIGLAGAGLIGGSLALALRGAHALRVYDADAATREAARRAGLDTVDTLAAVLPADAVVVATPLTDVVATLAALVDRADGAVLVDVASLRAPVNAYAERAPSRARIVGAHPMAGSTASGFAAADAELFRDRPFLVVPTARSDDRAMAVAGDIARAAGGAARRGARVRAGVSPCRRRRAGVARRAALAGELGEHRVEVREGLRDRRRAFDGNTRPLKAEHRERHRGVVIARRVDDPTV